MYCIGNFITVECKYRTNTFKLIHEFNLFSNMLGMCILLIFSYVTDFKLFSNLVSAPAVELHGEVIHIHTKGQADHSCAMYSNRTDCDRSQTLTATPIFRLQRIREKYLPLCETLYNVTLGCGGSFGNFAYSMLGNFYFYLIKNLLRPK